MPTDLKRTMRVISNDLGLIIRHEGATVLRERYRRWKEQIDNALAPMDVSEVAVQIFYRGLVQRIHERGLPDATVRVDQQDAVGDAPIRFIFSVYVGAREYLEDRGPLRPMDDDHPPPDVPWPGTIIRGPGHVGIAINEESLMEWYREGVLDWHVDAHAWAFIGMFWHAGVLPGRQPSARSWS